MLHQHVGKQQRERLAADQLARAPHRVAEAERRLLAGEACGAGLRQIGGEKLQVGELVALLERELQLELAVEMVLDHRLVAAGDEDEMLDAGLARLVHHVLDQRPVHHRQHLLGHRLGGGQEAGAEARHRENRFANRFHVGTHNAGERGIRPRGALRAMPATTSVLQSVTRQVLQTFANLTVTSRMAHWRAF